MARSEQARIGSYRVMPLSSSGEREKSFVQVILGLRPRWLWFLCGLFFGRALLVGELLPFGIAFITGLRASEERANLFWSTCGALVGLLTIASEVIVFPYIATIIVVQLINPGSKGANQLFRFWLLWTFLAFVLIKGPLSLLLYPMPILGFIALFEGLLAVISFSLIYRLLQQTGEEKLAHKEVQLSLVLIAAIAGLSFQPFGLSMRLLLTFYLILVAVKVGGLSLGAITGSAFAFLLLLLEGPAVPVSLLVSIPILTGLLVSVPGGTGIGAVAAFLFALGVPVEAGNIPLLVMIGCAVLFAYLTPDHYLRSLERIIPGTRRYKERQASHRSRVKELMSKKIQDNAEVFAELASSLKGCENQFLSQQLENLYQIVNDLGKSFAPDPVFAEAIEEKLLERLSDNELSRLTVLEGGDGFEIYGARVKQCGKGRFCTEVAQISGQILGIPYQVVTRGCQTKKNSCSFLAQPKPRYSLEVYTAKIAGEGQISGDSNDLLQLSLGKSAILLSDGMGIGERANQESSLTIRLLEKMMKAGYSRELAIKLINRVLLARTQDESFATIDLVLVDLLQGHLEFVKIGAAPSFIKRGSEVETIYNRNLPVGILQQVDVEPDRRLLKEGEYLVMVTDGILDAQRHVTNKEQWMSRLLRRMKFDLSCEELAQSLLACSLEVTGGLAHDDMMISVARLIRDDQEIYPYRGS